MGWLFDPQIWASLLTLTAIEIVLGIDNIVFITVATDDLPRERRPAAQRIGLALAFGMRVLLLTSVVWIAGLTRPIIEILGHAVSWKDLILITGGLFLLTKGTREMHSAVEGEAGRHGGAGYQSFARVVVQIMLLDAVFSLDSVITAVGMTQNYAIMIAAITIAIAVMAFAAGSVGDFIERHPTTKILALSFLLLVGVVLVADGLHFHIPRAYLYFAIGFSAAVEVLNVMAARRRAAKQARRQVQRIE
ncbi:MAG: TerC family protein [Sphingomonadales bacterium]